MKTKLLLILGFFSGACFSQSITPSVINSSGGTYQKGYTQIEWSVGEMALVQQMDARQNNTIVTNGFLQPYIINPGNNSILAVFEESEIKIFPNPARSYVEVNFLTRQRGKVTLGFFDASGRNVFNQSVTCYGVDLIYKIPVNRLAAGTYMLHLNLASFSGYISKSGVYKIVVIQ